MARTRLAALLEVLACSGFPTQIVLGSLLGLAGIAPFDAHHHLSARFVFALSIGDAVALIALAAWFLRLHGERLTRVVLGERPVGLEALFGLVQIPLLFLVVVTLMLVIRRFLPSLHNVPQNPFEGLIRTPADAWMFAGVATLGGGLREEVQRAFILHRFRQHLGGGAVGLVASSLAFGLGHVIQGRDVAVTTVLLGAFWGLVYLTRRSIASTVVSHSGFNAAEILAYSLYGA